MEAAIARAANGNGSCTWYLFETVGIRDDCEDTRERVTAAGKCSSTVRFGSLDRPGSRYHGSADARKSATEYRDPAADMLIGHFVGSRGRSKVRHSGGDGRYCFSC